MKMQSMLLVKALVDKAERFSYLYNGIRKEGFTAAPGTPLRDALDKAQDELDAAVQALVIEAKRGPL